MTNFPGSSSPGGNCSEIIVSMAKVGVVIFLGGILLGGSYLGVCCPRGGGNLAIII